MSVAAVRPGDQQGSRILGEVLAFAVKEQRSVRRSTPPPAAPHQSGPWVILPLCLLDAQEAFVSLPAPMVWWFRPPTSLPACSFPPC